MSIRIPNLLCLGLLLASAVGCDEGPPSDASEGKRLADFDPAEYDIRALDEVGDTRKVVLVDGELVDISDAVVGEWIVAPKGAEVLLPAVAPDSIVPDEDPSAALPTGDLELTAEAEALALCNCTFRDTYRVPAGYSQTWVCGIPSRNGTTCGYINMPIYHDVTCENYCNACGTVTCVDWTAGTATTAPSSSYLVSSAWFPCNAMNSCG